VALLNCISLFLFFSVGGPFGTINDAGNGILALLCAALALLLHRYGGVTVTAFACLGAASTVVGSYLVMSDTTGYFLAGLVSAFGFALVGVWLVLVCRSDDLPARRSGLAAGAVMALGLAEHAGLTYAPWSLGSRSQGGQDYGSAEQPSGGHVTGPVVALHDRRQSDSGDRPRRSAPDRALR
jgi:hypothetical protein